MQKIAIISDIHLKLRRHKAFELDRFTQLVDEISTSDADIVIINGDLLNHAVPTLDEIKAVNYMCAALVSKRVILISGNHEAVNKNSSTYDYIHFPHVEYIKTSTAMQIEGVSINLCSWGSIDTLHGIPSADILISHYRSTMEGLWDEEVNTSEFIDNYKLVILGDIHSRYSPQPNTIYTGPPYNIAYSRSTDPLGYLSLILHENKYTWTYVDLDLPRKIRVDLAYEDLGAFKPMEQHLYAIHLTGSLDQLSGIRNYDNVAFTKYITIKNADPLEPAQKLSNKPFIDTLIDKVGTQLKVPKKKKIEARNILITLQGDI